MDPPLSPTTSAEIAATVRGLGKSDQFERIADMIEEYGVDAQTVQTSTPEQMLDELGVPKDNLLLRRRLTPVLTNIGTAPLTTCLFCHC